MTKLGSLSVNKADLQTTRNLKIILKVQSLINLVQTLRLVNSSKNNNNNNSSNKGVMDELMDRA